MPKSPSKNRRRTLFCSRIITPNEIAVTRPTATQVINASIENTAIKIPPSESGNELNLDNNRNSKYVNAGTRIAETSEIKKLLPRSSLESKAQILRPKNREGMAIKRTKSTSLRWIYKIL